MKSTVQDKNRVAHMKIIIINELEYNAISFEEGIFCKHKCIIRTFQLKIKRNLKLKIFICNIHMFELRYVCH